MIGGDECHVDSDMLDCLYQPDDYCESERKT
jgi:hypothetical protein